MPLFQKLVRFVEETSNLKTCNLLRLSVQTNHRRANFFALLFITCTRFDPFSSLLSIDLSKSIGSRDKRIFPHHLIFRNCNVSIVIGYFLMKLVEAKTGTIDVRFLFSQSYCKRSERFEEKCNLAKKASNGKKLVVEVHHSFHVFVRLVCYAYARYACIYITAQKYTNTCFL